MKTTTLNVLYWTLTILFSLGMLMDGLSGLLRVEEGQAIMLHLKYPVYILSILGFAKVLGALAILQTRFPLLKEWAYAGFTINFLGGCASRAFIGDSSILIVSPLFFLAFMFLTYGVWKKWLAQKAQSRNISLA